MSGEVRPAVGSIAWRDLTVPDADSLRAFYEQVVGWKSSPVDLGGYSDFEMLQPASGESVAGICHARGSNADIPPQRRKHEVVRRDPVGFGFSPRHPHERTFGPAH